MPQAFSQSAQVRSSAIINRWISSLVFGSFSTIHTTTDLGSRERSPPGRLCGVTEGETQWRIEIGNGDRGARYSKVLRDHPAKLPIQVPLFKAPATLPGLTRRMSVAVAPQPTGASRVGNHGETKPQNSPDARRRYRVGLVEKQTPSCSGMHKMWSCDGRSGQHRPAGRRTGIDRV